MSEDHTVSFSLEVNVEQAYEDVRRLQTVMYRALGLARRLGLPEDWSRAALAIQQYIAALNQLRLAMVALQAASGPLGWALAGIGLATAGVSIADVVTDIEGH